MGWVCGWVGGKWGGAAALDRNVSKSCAKSISQRSLHNAPIFRLLLKVAVNGTHQCDFPNFCGQQCPTASFCATRLVRARSWPPVMLSLRVLSAQRRRSARRKKQRERKRERARQVQSKGNAQFDAKLAPHDQPSSGILAEGAIALPVTLSGGALFAS